MNAIMLKQMCHKLMLLGVHAIRVTFADGILCGACGALYGIVFGGFGAQARNEMTLSSLFFIGGLCAIIGFAIGAAVGVFNEVVRTRSIRRQSLRQAMQAPAKYQENHHFPISKAIQTPIVKKPMTLITAK